MNCPNSSARFRDHQGDVGRRLPPPDRQDRRFYARGAFNPHWGEQIVFGPGTAAINAVPGARPATRPRTIWQPFFDWVAASPQDFAIVSAPRIIAAPARISGTRRFSRLAGRRARRRPPGRARRQCVLGRKSRGSGHGLDGYQSAWLPASLLEDDQQESLVDALFAASRHWGLTLHSTRPLPARRRGDRRGEGHGDESRGLDAFALAISGARRAARLSRHRRS